MKRGTPEHPKTWKLANALDRPLPYAVGTLELLWHFTAKFAIQGNVGKWTDHQLAQALHWDGDAAHLVRALVVTGFLDECAKHRLIVHDWADHCDQSVAKTLKRRKLKVISPTAKRSGKSPDVSRHLPDMDSLPEPEPEPEPSQSLRPPKPPSRFTPPTIEQVAEYCRQRGNSVDPQAWMDHYEANGWKVGRNRMKDWKAAVRTWERSEFATAKAESGSPRPLTPDELATWQPNGAPEA